MCICSIAFYPKYKVYISTRFLEPFMCKHHKNKWYKKAKIKHINTSPTPTCPKPFSAPLLSIHEFFLNQWQNLWVFIFSEPIFSSPASLTIFAHACVLFNHLLSGLSLMSVLSAYPPHYKRGSFVSNIYQNMSLFCLEKSAVAHHYFQKKLKYDKQFILWSWPSGPQVHVAT